MEVIISLLIIIIAVLAYVIYRLLDRISFYEDLFVDAGKAFFNIGQRTKSILAGEIYSNEPVIVDFVEELKNVNDFLNNLDSEYNVFANIEEEDNG